MKYVSLGLKSVSGVFVVILLSVGLIYWLVEPNDFRDDISGWVKDKTGQTLELGEISLTLYPQIGLALNQVRLSNPEGFSDQSLFQAQEINVGAQLIPLIRGELKVKRLLLNGLALQLEKDAKGQTNLEQMAKAFQSTETPVEPQIAQDSTEPAKEDEAGVTALLKGLDFEGLSIVQSQLHYLDAQTQQRVDLTQVSVQTGRVRLGEPFEVALKAKLNMDGEALEDQLDARAQVLLAETQVTLSNAQLSQAIEGRLLPLKNLQTQLTIPQLTYDLAKGEVRMPDATLSAKAEGQADFALSQLQLDSHVSGLIFAQTAGSLKLDGLTHRFALKGESLPNGALSGQLSLVPTVDLHAQKVSLAKILLDLTELKSQLTGQARLENFAKPAIGFDLALNQLDVDAFLPKSQVSPEPVPSASNEPVKIELPEALIKDLDVDGRLAIGQLKVKGLEPKNLQLSLLAKGGQVKAALNQAALLDGSIQAKATLDVRGKQPAYQLDAQVEKMPIAPLLKAFAGTDMLSGQGRVKLALTTAGRDTQALMNNLNGPGELRLVDGAVKGFNLAQSIRKAKAKLSSDSQATTQATETLQTDFSELQGAFVFKQGVMQLTQMQAVAPYMRVNASGHVDLPASQLNLKVNAKIVNSDEGQGGEAFNDLKGLTLPIALKGPLTSPKVSLELTSVLKDKAKQQLEAEKAKAKAKLEEKKEAVAEELKEKVQEKFKSLFKF